jgi:hypothetical protein
MCSLPDAKCSILDGSCSIDPDLNLSDTQVRAIRYTLEGKPDRTIAATLDVSRTTLWRWKTHDKNYRTVLANARLHLRDTFADRIQNDLIDTADTLKRLLDNSADDKLRARVGDTLLRHGYRFLHQQNRKNPLGLRTPRNPKPPTPPAPA